MIFVTLNHERYILNLDDLMQVQVAVWTGRSCLLAYYSLAERIKECLIDGPFCLHSPKVGCNRFYFEVLLWSRKLGIAGAALQL